jgi:hypothetical protein
LKPLQRWQVVAQTIPAGIRTYYARPVRLWMLARLPRWTAIIRMEAVGRGWYRIPTHPVVEHCRLRFGVYGIEEGDLIRIERGRVIAMAYEDRHFCEIIRHRADGEIEEDPMPAEIAGAWANYRGARVRPSP